MQAKVSIATTVLACIVVGCDSNDADQVNEAKQAKAALLMVATLQERHWLKNSTYTSDLTKVGFESLPAMTPSGLYEVKLELVDEIEHYIATATYNGPDVDDRQCRVMTIDSAGETISMPRSDCWSLR